VIYENDRVLAYAFRENPCYEAQERNGMTFEHRWATFERIRFDHQKDVHDDVEVECGIWPKTIDLAEAAATNLKVNYLKAPPDDTSDTSTFTFRHPLRTVDKGQDHYELTLGALAVDRFGGIEFELRKEAESTEWVRAIATRDDIVDAAAWGKFVERLKDLTILSKPTVETTGEADLPLEVAEGTPIKVSWPEPVSDDEKGDALVVQLCTREDNGCQWLDDSEQDMRRDIDWLVFLPPETEVFHLPKVPEDAEEFAQPWVYSLWMGQVETQRLPSQNLEDPDPIEDPTWDDYRQNPPVFILEDPTGFGDVRMSHSRWTQP
jgi:hypothetical protein